MIMEQEEQLFQEWGGGEAGKRSEKTMGEPGDPCGRHLVGMVDYVQVRIQYWLDTQKKGEGKCSSSGTVVM